MSGTGFQTAGLAGGGGGGGTPYAVRIDQTITPGGCSGYSYAAYNSCLGGASGYSVCFCGNNSEATNTVYIGKALVGSLDSASVWQIKKIYTDITGLTSITWASGTQLFDKIWNNRLSYTYS